MSLSYKIISAAHPVDVRQFDGVGGWHVIDSPSTILPEGTIWLHLNYKAPRTQQWIQQQAVIPEIIRESLAGESKRPRCLRVGDGFFITLRGVPEEYEDIDFILHSVRIYITESLIITTNTGSTPFKQRFSQLAAIKDIPTTSAEWLVEILDTITDQLTDTLDNIYEMIITQENALIERETIERAQLAQIRRQLIVLRRYLFPQRDVIHKLVNDKISWLQESERRQLQEISERVGRCVDDIDAAISRTTILAEEISAMLAEGINKRTYTMSVLAAIFLPISFLTGLFGVNLSGIPGNQFQNAFIVFCLILVVIGALFGWWLNRRR